MRKPHTHTQARALYPHASSLSPPHLGRVVDTPGSNAASARHDRSSGASRPARPARFGAGSSSLRRHVPDLLLGRRDGDNQLWVPVPA